MEGKPDSESAGRTDEGLVLPWTRGDFRGFANRKLAADREAAITPSLWNASLISSRRRSRFDNRCVLGSSEMLALSVPRSQESFTVLSRLPSPATASPILQVPQAPAAST